MISPVSVRKVRKAARCRARDRGGLGASGWGTLTRIVDEQLTPKKRGRLRKASSQHALIRFDLSEISTRGGRVLRVPSSSGPCPYYAAQHFRGKAKAAPG